MYALFQIGQIGDWKNYFDEALNAKFDQWIESCTRNTDLRFPMASSSR